MLSVRQDFRKSRFKQYEIGSRDSIKKGSFKRDSNRSIESQKYNSNTSNEMLGVVEATNNLLTSNVLNLFVIQTIGILIINR